MTSPYAANRLDRSVWEFDEHNRRILLWQRARTGAALALGKDAPGDPEPAHREPPALPPPDAYSNWTGIVDECVARYGVKLTEVRRNAGRSRTAILCMQELCYRLARFGRIRNQRMTYAAIGRILNRDHSTIIYNARVHAKRVGDSMPHILSRQVDEE